MTARHACAVAILCTAMACGGQLDPITQLGCVPELCGDQTDNDCDGAVDEEPCAARCEEGCAWGCGTTHCDDPVALSVGRVHSCALRGSGGAACWGANGSGQLGDGTTTRRPDPVSVVDLGDAIALSAGRSQTCALHSDRGVSCWGESITRPTRVPGLRNVHEVSTGGRHSCVRLGDTVECWGKNEFGQLGDGGTGDRDSPEPVVGLSDVASVSAGTEHTCALHHSGRVSCWGRGYAGRLGNGSEENSALPVEVQGVTDAISVSSGDWHSCALRATGELVCWGYNDDGELGDGTLGDQHTAVPVQMIEDVAFVSAGGRHTCAFRADGRPFCWGIIRYGSLGSMPRTLSVPAPVDVLDRVVDIGAGQYHGCALAPAGGGVYCWGRGREGNTGIHLASEAEFTPTAVLPP